MSWHFDQTQSIQDYLEKNIIHPPFKSSYVFLVLARATPLPLNLQYPHLGHQLETFLEFNSYNSFKQGFVTYVPSSTLFFHDLHNINMISLGQFLVTTRNIRSPKLDNNLKDIHTFRDSKSNHNTNCVLVISLYLVNNFGNIQICVAPHCLINLLSTRWDNQIDYD